jgi:ATP-dependent helicase/nuclease subunit A
MPNSSGRGRPLADEAARAAIREDLATTILVEAAAGTGKTTCLVGRMVALVASGRATVDRLSAVTFTIRAAAQLRQRFQIALETAHAKEPDLARRARLAEALSGLDRCFLGTIHAFAARLLRERPVEAGVDPGFLEMDEPDDGAARRTSWDAFAAELFARDDARIARLAEVNVPLRDLFAVYETLCENSDVEPAIGPERPEPDFRAARSAVDKFLAEARAAVPDEPPPDGYSGFQEAVRQAQRRAELYGSGSAAGFARVLECLRSSEAEKKAGGFRPRVVALREQVVEPALAAWREYLHPILLPLAVEARDAYAAWRRRSGRLNFQDLLVLARDLLRGHPAIREALRARFTPILVDEFQDTDPIQAEILFYLTGAETEEKDWRRVTPVPGSLFVVGDPKQSIYRFRRADIETYEIVRRRVADSGGRVLDLSTNFRSRGALCDWVNGVFGRPEQFPAAPTREQAAYVPIHPEKPDASPDPRPAALRLEVPTAAKTWPVVQRDAARVAAAIAADVAAGRRRPGDFLVLLRKRRAMPEYARALEEHGVPYEIAGGDAFGGSEELGALLPVLQALADPDDPVPYVAALRGPLFGVDDGALYRFARAGGRFSHRAALPDETDARIRGAAEIFREAERDVETLPPGAAVSRVAGRLGATASAAAKPLGDSRAGNLLKALAAARALSADGLSFPQIVRKLESFRAENMIEQMGLEPGRPGVVRLMTLHGAKGLEAPVVFLADPTGDVAGARNYWIERQGGGPARGHFRIVRRSDSGRKEVEIARPAGWAEMSEREDRFDDAEKIRLLYVGATRAADTLVVSVRRGAKGQAGGPWLRLDPYLRAGLPETEAPARTAETAPGNDAPAALAAFRSRLAARKERARRPARAAVSVTALAHAGDAPGRVATGRGMEWGRIVHRLLEALMRDRDLPLRAYAANLFAEEDRPEADLDDAVRLAEAVRDSPLWRRALAAKRRLVEVPFVLSVESRELGAADAPPTTVLSGAIDLAFEEDGGWVLVDYKSDRIGPDGVGPLAGWYAPQIRMYRRYWDRMTGGKSRAGLFFVETGEEVWLEEGERKGRGAESE